MALNLTLVCECLVGRPHTKDNEHRLVLQIKRLLAGRKLRLGSEIATFHCDIPKLRIISVYSPAQPETPEFRQLEFIDMAEITDIDIHFYSFKKQCHDIFRGDETPLFDTVALPSEAHDTLWEGLHFEYNTQFELLRAINAIVSFSLNSACQMVEINRIILLHGPPGTGKTTLSKAVAQKTAIRTPGLSFSLLEINCQALFSKWFAESGKQVEKLFADIRAVAREKNKVLFVLIDEIETITIARQTALDGNEPSDLIRAVNSLLTQIDRLRECRNIIILGTTNMLHILDEAFLSRVDITIEMPPPSHRAVYNILSACIREMAQAGLLKNTQSQIDFFSLKIMEDLNSDSTPNTEEHPRLLYRIAKQCSLQKISGRKLRKIPFVFYAKLFRSCPAVDASALLHLLLAKTESACKTF